MSCSGTIQLRFTASLLSLALFLSSPAGFAADMTPAPAPTPRTEETNIQETLRSYLQLQEQLHATQLAIERNRKEAEAASADSAKVFSARLQGIEEALAAQRTQELAVMQNSNKVMLIVAGLFAALGFLAMLFMAYFQWRTISRLAEVSAALPFAHNFSPAASLAALGSAGARLHCRTLWARGGPLFRAPFTLPKRGESNPGRR